jgi:hypothetical protein
METKPDPSAWFDENELQLCPECGARRIVPPTDHATNDFLLCFDCGVIPNPTVEQTAR